MHFYETSPPNPAATIDDTKGTSSVLTEDLVLERQITRTNVWSKVAQPVKDWIITFFFLLFPPVTQHDPISVRVQAIPAHVVQTGEWLLMISDEFLFKTVKRETEKIFIVVWNDHRWWTHRSEDLLSPCTVCLTQQHRHKQKALRIHSDL